MVEEKFPALGCYEGISVIGARRIGSLRDGYAIVEGKIRIIEASSRELAQQPAVLERIVQHDRVA